ncbi:Eukaryotic aspartyl protease family protein [Theobroma cacao]|uniref:Eukaryotic aspartyl protease family protein n=1 Tax=Theobroma cacao TaxID=3641 RepID=A0A061GPT7_THECC|nr:Eukaryotic aspartyl protease family protein [Theobroma cacao]
MAQIQSLFLAFTILSLSGPIILAVPSDPRRLVVNLIHQDTIHSPFHGKSEDLATRLERTLQIRRTLPTTDIQADLVPIQNLFFVNFSIGQPPVPQLALMDTGSSLLWLQCQPCHRCSYQNSPIYDSRSSSTYTMLPCSSKYCTYSQPLNCTSSIPCFYNQQYVNGVGSMGNLAQEQLSFRTFDDGLVVVHDVIFGCGFSNGDLQGNKQMNGVFGLGFEPVSLATRLAKFSYCIGNVIDPSYIHNKLFLGDGAGVEGDSTPLKAIDGQYHVLLEGISVGEKKLPIDPNVFEWKGVNTGVIIDSGSVSTWLVKEAYDAIVKEVKSLLDPWLTETFTQKDHVCYRGTINQDLEGFPTMTFLFVGGAELVLDTTSLFFQIKPDEFCLLVRQMIDSDQSVIGLMAQQNYNVAYDINGKKLSFQRIDCELLAD